MTKVVVGLSGGVDSSVAAYLLKEQGYDVVGLFMKNWDDTEGLISKDCPWREDRIDAMKVASKLGIPFKTVDLVTEYKERIVDYMFEEYERGRTPNPDILCNREIKFDVFLDKALELGADYVATGHYCRKGEKNGIFQLLAGKDPNKDQSYFLCQVNQKQLSQALFPVGELLKPEVREIAATIGLNTATKKDSQGLCFIGKVDLPKFLQQKLKAKKGDIIEIPRDFKLQSGEKDFQSADGSKVGEHNGAHFFTIGQRKGLDVGGTEKPLFVLATDVKENIVYVGQGTNHPGLFRNELFIQNNDIHWIREDLKMKEGEEKEFSVRVRYRQPLQKALLILESKGLKIIFEESQRAIAAGQFAAWYNGEELIGSGVIEE